MDNNNKFDLTTQNETTEMAIPQLENLMINMQQLGKIYKIATTYSNSTMIPQNYQRNPDNCFVACELAARMNVSPILVMQNLYIVQGKPSWSGKATKALIDGCGRFEKSEYVFIGEQGNQNWGCYLQAVNKHTNKVVKGTTVTWQMALDEGWVYKKGSKWQTMPEQMMKYRAASFFANTECPEALMGFQTAEEVQDTRKDESENKVVISL